MEYWNIETLEYWNIGILEYWNIASSIEILEYGNDGILEYLNIVILKDWNQILEHRNMRILKYWNIEILYGILGCCNVRLLEYWNTIISIWNMGRLETYEITLPCLQFYIISNMNALVNWLCNSIFNIIFGIGIQLPYKKFHKADDTRPLWHN